MKNKKIVIAIIAVLLIVLAVVLFLTLKKPTITITFNTNKNTTYEKIKIKKGDLVKLPENDPKKDGFKFVAWILEDETIIEENFKPTEDTVLYAKWISEDAETFIIKFDSKGGSEVEDLIVEKGKELKLPTSPTKDGYEFISWVDKFETPINDGALLDCDEEMTLYANWKKIEEDSINNDENKKIEVTGVSLDKGTVELIIGKTGKLNATISPNNATNKKVTYTSNKPDVIAVDNSGNLTAKQIGEATITVKTNNDKTATAKVYSDVESISISVDNQYISYYGSAKKVANVTVKTIPYVDSNYITFDAPDASGNNAPVYGKQVGHINTYTADRDVWSTGYATVPVKAIVGRKTSNEIRIYVEPELKINKAYGDAAVNEQYESGSLVSLTTNTNVTWYYPTSGDISVNNVTETATIFKAGLVNNRQYASGIQIKATSKAGQTASISLNVNVKR